MLLVLGGGALAACDDGGCSDELKIALEVHINAPVDLTIDKVTAELTGEAECGSFRPDKNSDERVYTCYEQKGEEGHGGAYVLRVYSGGQEIHSETKLVTADACHAELATAYLTVEAPAE